MATAKLASTSGKEHYDEIYRSELELEAEWLRFGAREKVNSIEELLRRSEIRPKTVLELGAGTGAVITECQRRGLGAEFVSLDYSAEAVSYLRENSSGIERITADITAEEFKVDRDFDLVILSHVVEHLEEPLAFLQSLLRKIRFRHLIAEVPLEDLFVLRLRNRFRDRTRNRAVHVQFFTESSFRNLLEAAQLKIIDRRRYVPITPPAILRLLCRKDRFSKIRSLLTLCTRFYLPVTLKPIWGRLYYSHVATLCVRR